MSLYNWTSLRLLAPALDAARRTSTIASLKELEQSQWWPASRLEELQSLRLQTLIQHAYDHVPFYRHYMREAGLGPGLIRSSSDLHLLPILGRADVRRLASELVAEYVPGGRTVASQTGGSTGEPLRFLSTPHDRRSRGFARSLRAQGWSGYHLGDRSLLLVESRHWDSPRDRVLRSVQWGLQRTTYWQADNLSTEQLELLARHVDRRQLQFLVGYTSALYLLALHVRDRGGLSHRIQGIVAGGEPLHDAERETMMSAFGVKPISKYSSNEILDIACQCDLGRGYHVAVEDVVVEILDAEGRNVPPGQVGRVVVTNLHNLAMPFIRYDLGDLGALDAHGCNCGRGLPLLSSLEGRQSDVLFTPDGRRVPGIVLPWSYLAGSGVRQIQIVQQRLDFVQVSVVLEPGMNSNAEAVVLTGIRTRYQQTLGSAVAVQVVPVSEIPVGPRGKRAVVVSNLARKATDDGQ